MNVEPGTSSASAKACGSCTLCCKVMTIAELSKPSGDWCPHCKPGKGCAIYSSRPPGCRAFMCSWLLEPSLGPQWRPDKSKLVLIADARSGRMFIRCDPGFPQAWRKEPFYTQIRQWGSRAGPSGGEVFIGVGHDITVVARGRELPIGTVTDADSLATEYDASGRLLRCRVIPGSADLCEVDPGRGRAAPAL